MKFIGQPADYSEILQRVFVFSVATGFACMLILATASPAAKAFTESIPDKVDLGLLKDQKLLSGLIPLGIGIFSRMIKLHDRISDLFRIRFFFDTRFFLFPLCRGAGVVLSDGLKKKIRQNRNPAMYATVYKYAGFKTPQIDDQLVRTAADNWGWFWVLVESSFLLFLTTAILLYLREWGYVRGFLLAIFIELILMFFMGLACIRSAKPQVDAILADNSRKESISDYFNSL